MVLKTGKQRDYSFQSKEWLTRVASISSGQAGSSDRRQPCFAERWRGEGMLWFTSELFLPGKSTFWIWPELLSRLRWTRLHSEANFLVSRYLSLHATSAAEPLPWNEILKSRVFSLSHVRAPRSDRMSRITGLQSGKLKSDDFASSHDLHLLDFTEIQLYIIAGMSSMGTHISLFDLLLIFALSCFSIQEALYGNSLTVQYSLELLPKCGSENSTWELLVGHDPSKSISIT